MADSASKQRRRGPPNRPGTQGGKRDLNRRKRVHALIDAGLGLFLDQGIEGVTIDEVAREAATAKGNFYRYFRDKEDLVEAVMEPFANAVRAALQGCDEALQEAAGRKDTIAAYAQLAAGLATALTSHADATRLYLQERRSPTTPARRPVSKLAEEFDQRAIALSQSAVDRGLLVVDDPRISALAVSGAVETLALASLRKQFPIDPLQTSQTLIHLVLDGIRRR